MVLWKRIRPLKIYEHTLYYYLVDWCRFCNHIRSLWILPSPYAKPLSKSSDSKILVGVYMIFHFVKFRLSLCNNLWDISIQPNLKFKIQQLVRFVFLFFLKLVLLDVIHHLKIYHHTKFHTLTFTGAIFASTSEVWTYAMLEWLKLRD
jgi:hypothetical protein